MFICILGYETVYHVFTEALGDQEGECQIPGNVVTGDYELPCGC